MNESIKDYMAKRLRGSNRANARNKQNQFEEYESEMHIREYAPKVVTEPLKAKNKNQQKYMTAIENAVITFGIGPAGTGKTYICGALAADALRDRKIEKIIITRPAVEAGESLGFLPGEVEEKYAPYLQPFKDVLYERLGKSTVDCMLKGGRIEPAPLAYMRGRTFKNAIVILDEAQNATPQQMKMFLTRIGENCRVIVNGDIKQKDISGESGLDDAVRRLAYIPTVRVVEFTSADIVRSGIVQEIVESYERPPTELHKSY